MSENNSWEILEKNKEDFANSKSLSEAYKIASNSVKYHGWYQHYTTLSRLYEKLLSRKWWFSRSDNVRLNDLREYKKYGKRSVQSRSYQASFSYGVSESAAMWALYCKESPMACRILIKKDAMLKWTKEIAEKKLAIMYGGKNISKQLPKDGRELIEQATFRDIIYASVRDPDLSYDKHDKNRGRTLSWNGAITKEIHGLEDEIKSEEYSTWIKDLEWNQERESRLVVRLAKRNYNLPKAIAITIPDEVLKSMRITLSPWLKEEDEEEVMMGIRVLLESVHGANMREERFIKRSTLSGALNFQLRQ